MSQLACDSAAFVDDVDLAINHVRSVAREEFAKVPQPNIRQGHSMREATGAVCVALVLRQLQQRQRQFDEWLEAALQDARAMLIAKNQAYGDSALNPLRVFSTASLKEQLLVRLDDKASRLARGHAAGEDVAMDMLGYIILVAIAEKREA